MEQNVEELAKKSLLDCNESELRIRCANTERSLKQAYQIIQKLEKENADMKEKLDMHRRIWEATRDIDEEFE